MNDYGDMVRQLRLLSLVSDKPQPFRKPVMKDKPRPGSADWNELQQKARRIEDMLANQPVVPILPDDPNAQ
jgi:hypothetical protein